MPEEVDFTDLIPLYYVIYTGSRNTDIELNLLTIFDKLI